MATPAPPGAPPYPAPPPAPPASGGVVRPPLAAALPREERLRLAASLGHTDQVTALLSAGTPVTADVVSTDKLSGRGGPFGAQSVRQSTLGQSKQGAYSVTSGGDCNGISNRNTQWRL